jgi:hypothetical protein
MIAAVMLLVIPGCKELNGESSEKFPDCVGIEGIFDPYNIQQAYRGRIWSQDTSFTTQFIFTEYSFDLSLLSTTWVMYLKRNLSPTSVSYQSAICVGSDATDTWYANTSFDFDGQYTVWDFYFEEFDCSDLSGYCTVTRPDIPDTLDFNFEGSR